jgi:hypothetical protein
MLSQQDEGTIREGAIGGGKLPKVREMCCALNLYGCGFFPRCCPGKEVLVNRLEITALNKGFGTCVLCR